MRSSHVPKLVLGGLLILTLSFKIPGGVRQSMSRQDEMVRTHIATFLARQGFEPDRAIASKDLIAVSGRSGGCQLLIAEAAPEGFHRHILRRFASDGDQFFFWFRGRKYQDQPVWLTRLSAYWNTAVRKLGLNAGVEPVFGVVASPACDLDAMPWRELAESVATARR